LAKIAQSQKMQMPWYICTMEP